MKYLATITLLITYYLFLSFFLPFLFFVISNGANADKSRYQNGQTHRHQRDDIGLLKFFIVGRQIQGSTSLIDVQFVLLPLKRIVFDIAVNVVVIGLVANDVVVEP